MTVPISALEKNKRDAAFSRALLPIVVFAGAIIFGLSFTLLAFVCLGVPLSASTGAGLAAVVALGFVLVCLSFAVRCIALAALAVSGIHSLLAPRPLLGRFAAAVLQGPFDPPRALT